jgi:hypothetical protein
VPQPLGLGAYCRPVIGRKDDDGDISPGKVLLENHVLVASDKRLEAGLFCGVEQIAVGQSGSAHLEGGADIVRRQDVAHAERSVLVEQNSHPFEGWAIFAKRSTARTRSTGTPSKTRQ